LQVIFFHLGRKNIVILKRKLNKFDKNFVIGGVPSHFGV